MRLMRLVAGLVVGTALAAGCEKKEPDKSPVPKPPAPDVTPSASAGRSAPVTASPAPASAKPAVPATGPAVTRTPTTAPVAKAKPAAPTPPAAAPGAPETAAVADGTGLSTDKVK